MRATIGFSLVVLAFLLFAMGGHVGAQQGPPETKPPEKKQQAPEKKQGKPEPPPPKEPQKQGKPQR